MLESLLQSVITNTPDKPLVESQGRTWAASEVENLSDALVSSLIRLGLEPIDRVAFLLPNCVETIVSYLACFKGGFVSVPLDYRYRPVQINYALNHSGAL